MAKLGLLAPEPMPAPKQLVTVGDGNLYCHTLTTGESPIYRIRSYAPRAEDGGLGLGQSAL